MTAAARLSFAISVLLVCVAADCPGGAAGGGGGPAGSFDVVDDGLCDGTPCEDGPSDGTYTGEPEAGVVCGDALCAETPCCVIVDAQFEAQASCLAPDATCAGEGTTVTVACDGAEDCDAGEVCCFASLSATCVEAGACTDGGLQICVTAEDCGEDTLCCGLPSGFPLPVDAGACAPAADGCPAL